MTMKNVLLCFLLLATGVAYAQPSPRQLYPGLFEAVQLGRVYPDNKTFVDLLPTVPPAEVVAAYQREKDQPGFDLKAFTQRYFVQPTEDTIGRAHV